jgi:hypothetical protein
MRSGFKGLLLGATLQRRQAIVSDPNPLSLVVGIRILKSKVFELNNARI